VVQDSEFHDGDFRVRPEMKKMTVSGGLACLDFGRFWKKKKEKCSALLKP
jgi:hypothetical protein